MTSVAVALAVDSRGPCALYIISDSRITWGSPTKRWDSGQKTFASSSTPDVFGFCGDAFFPPTVLGQVLDLTRSGVLFPIDADAEARHRAFVQLFQQSLQTGSDAPIKGFSFFHGTRDGDGMSGRFRLWQTKYNAARWADMEHDLTKERSYLVIVDGSGRHAVEQRGTEWLGTGVEGTSRAAIWSFCDALRSQKDPFSGGAPQLVGIWRIGNARRYGFIWNGKKFVSGLELPNVAEWDCVDWFNDLFERCDGQTGERLPDAQRHAKPK
jgi:hypothetical protein